MFLLFGFIVGFGTAAYGTKHGWSQLRIVLTSLVLSLVGGAVLFVAAAPRAGAAELQGIAELRNTAVRVEGAGCSGSGSIVEGKSGHHFLITNSHVCQCAKYKGRVYASRDGGELIEGAFVKQDWSSDLCAARVDDKIPALKLGHRLVPYTSVHTRGYPGGHVVESSGRVLGGVDWMYEAPIEAVGECPKPSRQIRDYGGQLRACVLQFHSQLTNLYSRPGSSGSAVVNDAGELVGTISSWHPDNAYDAGMVTFDQLKNFLETL